MLYAISIAANAHLPLCYDLITGAYDRKIVEI